MKTIITTLILVAALAIGAAAEMETWTTKEGTSIKMKLLHVNRDRVSASAKFQLEDGGIVTLAPAILNEESLERMIKWKPTPGTNGFFDHMFNDDLVILEGDRFIKHELKTKPAKYYIFYYTASWCVPCRKFTPELVEFYKKHKNDNFEIIMVTSDSKEERMLEYAKLRKMPWPQVACAKARNINGLLDHGVWGLPDLVVCDLQGNNIGNFEFQLDELAELIK